jgi:DNA-binding cell septation regulator SpoVG
MKITSVDISFPSPRSKVEHPQLLGFVSIVFDGCFVIHEIKIIGCEGGKFLAFPSKEVNIPCPSCNRRTPARYTDCNHCGKEVPLREDCNYYSDISHPITNQFRLYIHNTVISEYEKLTRVSNPEIPDNSFVAGIF